MDATFYVHGVALVNTGGELCDACGQRKAVGRSVAGHVLCPRCAGWAAVMAEEYAREVEAEKERQRRSDVLPELAPATVRKAAKEAKHARNGFRCGHPNDEANIYRHPHQGTTSCRECRRIRQRKARRALALRTP
jgi:uncharacterized Zn finger protein (UPF0148 family)